MYIDTIAFVTVHFKSHAEETLVTALSSTPLHRVLEVYRDKNTIPSHATFLVGRELHASAEAAVGEVLEDGAKVYVVAAGHASTH